MDFISLTDIARVKNPNEPRVAVQNWMRLYNPNFKGVEFEAFKNEAGSNVFVLSPQE